jgi:Virulence-associated protein E
MSARIAPSAISAWADVLRRVPYRQSNRSCTSQPCASLVGRPRRQRKADFQIIAFGSNDLEPSAGRFPGNPGHSFPRFLDGIKVLAALWLNAKEVPRGYQDRARPAYGRARIDLPCRCVIWATTNNSEYLKSQTGNRRFWPLSVGAINIEALKRDRDQLLAEAVALDDMGMSIVLPRDLWGVAAEEQEQRREADPWEDILREIRGELVGNERRVVSHDLLETQIGIPKERQTTAHGRRIGDCMRILGWKGPKQMRLGERNGRGYWRT